MSDSNKSSLFFKQIIYLIINVGTDNLRDCLYFEVGKSNINDRLRSEELQAEFRLLWSRNCITEEEFDKLTRNPNPDTYDISLLMLLLANSKVCDIAQPLNGWIKTPSDSDLSLGADLVRLREIRNEIIDQEYIVKMTETHFEGLWVQIKHILTRIASRRGTDAEQNIKLKVKEAKVAKEVQDDNALDKFIHWYEQDTKEYQKCLSDVQDSLKDLHLKVDNTSQPLDEDTFKTDHESLQSKVKRIVGSFRLSAQHVFEIVSCGTVDTVRNALPYLDETVELITEAYGSIIKRWKEFKLFCNSGLPSVILRMDEKSIEMYKKALADGTVPDHSIRLMIVGHVGESVNIEEREGTQGIEVHVGRCQIDMTSNNWIVQEKGDAVQSNLNELARIINTHLITDPDFRDIIESDNLLAPMWQVRWKLAVGIG